jgi:hypothetical protein
VDIFENIQKINEQEDSYRHRVELSVHFKSPVDDDYDVDVSKDVELVYDIEVDYRSWGIKDINVTPRSMDEFEVVIRSIQTAKEEDVSVKVDFDEVTPSIFWLEGRGVAPAEVHVTLGEDNKVVDVEIDFYYWKP